MTDAEIKALNTAATPSAQVVKDRNAFAAYLKTNKTPSDKASLTSAYTAFKAANPNTTVPSPAAFASVSGYVGKYATHAAVPGSLKDAVDKMKAGNQNYLQGTAGNAAYQNDPTMQLKDGVWSKANVNQVAGSPGYADGAGYNTGPGQFKTFKEMAAEGLGQPVWVPPSTADAGDAGTQQMPGYWQPNAQMVAKYPTYDAPESFFEPFVNAAKDLGPFVAMTSLGGGLAGNGFGGILGDIVNGLSGNNTPGLGNGNSIENAAMNDFNLGDGITPPNSVIDPNFLEVNTPPGSGGNVPGAPGTVPPVVPPGTPGAPGTTPPMPPAPAVPPDPGPLAPPPVTPPGTTPPPTVPPGTGTGTALSRILGQLGGGAEASGADWLSLLGTLGSTGLGILGSNQQADALRDIAAQARTDRQPFLDKSLQWLNDPAAYAAGPGKSSLDATLRALSVQGNPLGNPTSLALAGDIANRGWQNAVTGFGNIGLSGSDSRNSLLSSAATADRGVTTAIGSGWGTLTQPQSDFDWNSFMRMFGKSPP